MRVIEDAVQAIGSEDASGRRAGSLGDIGCFSTEQLDYVVATIANFYA